MCVNYLDMNEFNKEALVDLMNDLYKNEISLMNNFLPNTKLKEKQRVEAKIIKKYEKTETPYQRVMTSKNIPDAKKKRAHLHLSKP